jgi:glycosyltransferase involved in cell wall biosynthesis
MAGDQRDDAAAVPPVPGADTITVCGSGESSRIDAHGGVKVLVVSPRMPAAGGKGDQLRAFQFVQAMACHHTVEIATTGAGGRMGGAAADLSAVVSIRLHETPLAARVCGALGALLRGQPAQVGWMTPGRSWQAIRRGAVECDVVLAITVRALRGPLPVPLVLDHIDALSVNMRRRATGPERAPIRWAARLEAVLLGRWERRLSQHAAAQIAISALDARLLPSPPEVRIVPNCIDVSVQPLGNDGERDIDLIFTGNMAYPPNADAARWLSDVIAPALWARRPGTSVWVVGRDAGRLALDPRLEVRADVPDLGAYLGRARIALAPLRLGTGSPNKVLEAMAAGAAVLATPIAVEPFAFPPDAVETAGTAPALAAAAERLLADAPARSAMVDRARSLVLAYSPEAQRERLETILAGVATRQVHYEPQASSARHESATKRSL